MYSKLHTLFIALFALLLVAPATSLAQGTTAELKTMLQQRDADIKAVLGSNETLTDAQRTQLKALINDDIDFDAMGEAALGRQWQKLSPDQQTQFLSVFSEIIRTQSLSNLDPYRAAVTYGDITIDGTDAMVETTTTYKKVATPVVYHMAFTDGTWRVTDIVLDDISTVASYARSFQSLIRKRGFDALMTRLNEKLAEVQAEVAG
ncbi:MAG: ABC transporter substrate-binding protein [Rhodothermales bacterium]